MTIRVLIVDDSALIRRLLTELLGEDPDIDVVGAACDPFQARDMIKSLTPDVLTLDIEMPRMDGLAFLEKIMTLRPMPVVMVSSLTEKGATATLQALELGAVDFVAKPAVALEKGIVAMARELRQKVKVAAATRVRPRTASRAKGPSSTARSVGRSTERIVAIGASTGGVSVLRDILVAFPASGPAVLVTQHMPVEFTKRFAERLDRASAMSIVEAQHGMRVLPGHAYVAPGSQHLRLDRSGANYVCALDDGPPVSGHKPSVDVLFRSVAVAAGANAVGVILTGMGRDGADGLLAMRRAGAATLGQNQESCVVYGMPRAAFEIGAVEEEHDVEGITGRMLALTGGGMQHVRV